MIGAVQAARRGAASLWTPTSLFTGGVQGWWYDPADFSTLFQDAAGTTPVTGTGQPVGRVLDKSGNANHLTTPGTGFRPTIEVAGGYYYLRFDGADDRLVSSAAVNMSTTDEISVCITASFRNLPAVQMAVELGSNSLAYGGFFIVTEAANAIFAPRGDRIAVLGDNTPAAVAIDTVYVLNGKSKINAGTKAQIRKNATLAGESTSTTFGGGNFSSTLFLNIGSRSGGLLPGCVGACSREWQPGGCQSSDLPGG